MTFFLATYLHSARNIEATPVVGYVNDGESDATASHAWLEFGGKKTDLTLAQTAHPDAQPPGHILILDRVMQAGRVSYTYHLERDDAALKFEKELAADPRFGAHVRRKQLEHQQMTGIAHSVERMRRFLDAAPDGMTYDVLSRRLG